VSERLLIAAPLGAPGFTSFVKGLERVGVLSRVERLEWIRLHGAVVRASGLPLDPGDGVSQELLDRLEEEFGR
jgi:hypothetical protein